MYLKFIHSLSVRKQIYQKYIQDSINSLLVRKQVSHILTTFHSFSIGKKAEITLKPFYLFSIGKKTYITNTFNILFLSYL